MAASGKAQVVQMALEKLTCFLEPYLPIINAHMVHFFTGQEWNNLSPELQTDLLALDEMQLAKLPDDHLNIGSRNLDHIRPTLRQLMEDIQKHSLCSLKILDDLPSIWNCMGIQPLTSTIHFDKFMSAKKTHEVGALSDVIASLSNQTGSNLIVDLGCGKGALGSILSLNHGVYVSGIDAAGFDFHVEEGRKFRMEKTFQAEVRKSTEATATDPAGHSVKFRRTTQFLSSKVDLGPFIQESSQHFGVPFQQVGLVGLHTCGNLASTSLQLFVNSPQTNFLCNVGCCYHLLDEAFGDGCCGPEPGFPLSQTLKSKRFSMGRNARMVANQSLERYAAENRLQPDVLFYRSLLQVLFQDKFPSVDHVTFQVGRLRRPLPSFNDYARWAVKRLQLNLELKDEEMDDYLERYNSQRKHLQAFFQLRLLLAPLIETTILLDRLAFLKEQDVVSHSFLVQIFSPVTSPRCYALLAFKEPFSSIDSTEEIVK